MYIAGQPTADGIRQLPDQGVTTVVNLRTPAEMARVGFDEAALVASLGFIARWRGAPVTCGRRT
jgi:protein tyrosine phosphatase (PTP) superfamily phosphohydrolase (DUF442 family)